MDVYMQKNETKSLSLILHKSQLQVNQRSQHAARVLNCLRKKCRAHFISYGYNGLNRLSLGIYMYMQILCA